VPDTAAGKKIRCPKCKGAMDVPAPAAELPEFVPPPAEPQAPPASFPPSKPAPPRPKPAAPPPKPDPPPPKVEQWFLQTEDGEDYGPVPRDELDAWFAEGRITNDCQLLREGTDQWQWANDVYLELNESRPAASPQPAPEEPPAAAVNSRSKQSPAGKSRGQPAAEPVAAGPPSSRSRMVAGLLGIFLGPLGTHRFYLGYWVIGLLMLATAGGCGLWSLIDAILVFLGKVPDADGRRLS
jgi:hypothetical protein